MWVRSVLWVVCVLILLCWRGAPTDRSQLRSCVSVPTPRQPFWLQKSLPRHLPPCPSHVLSLMSELICIKLYPGRQKDAPGNFNLTQVPIRLLVTAVDIWLSLTTSQRCNSLHIPLDLLLYYCLQNAESRFCICGKSCWELSPFWPHVFQISHFSVRLCNF